MLYFSRVRSSDEAEQRSRVEDLACARRWQSLLLAAMSYGVVRVVMILTGLQKAELQEAAIGLGATFLRVNVALLLGALWTIPAGVAIGFNPRLARIAQPLAQIAASVPATALFPVVLLLLIRVGGGLGIGSIVLLLLGTQWYILFNVIAGAIAIPTDLKECCSVFRLRGIERWKKLILPGIFPYLVTGMVTASGGAWNASIVAEYFHFKGHIYTTVGTGRDHLPGHRCRQLRPAAGRNHDDGGDGGDHQSPGVAQDVCAGRDDDTGSRPELALRASPLVTFEFPHLSFHQLLTCASCWRNGIALLV